MQQQSSTIFKLPVEILQAIFLICVCDSTSPHTLSHICAEWRAVARHCGQLWTEISLSSPERARDSFLLSGSAPLTVSWNEMAIVNTGPSPAYLRLERRDWIWEHCDRFRDLRLGGPAALVKHAFSKLRVALPILQTLSVTSLHGHDEDGRLIGFESDNDGDGLLYHPFIEIPMHFTCHSLQKMHLELVRTSLRELISLVKNAPRLDQMLMNMVTFDDAGRFLECHCESSLRVLYLQDLWNPGDLLRCFPYPSESLVISGNCIPLSAEYWNDTLVPVLTSRLGRLSLAHLNCERGKFHLTEDGIEGRCSVSLRIFDYLPYEDTATLPANPAQFHLPSLETITVLDPAGLLKASAIVSLRPKATTLEVCGETLSIDHIAKLPELREVCVVAADLHPEGEACIKLLHGLRLRRVREEGHETSLGPLAKLVLHGCSGVEGSLAMLQEEVVEIVIENDSEDRRRKWWHFSSLCDHLD